MNNNVAIGIMSDSKKLNLMQEYVNEYKAINNNAKVFIEETLNELTTGEGEIIVAATDALLECMKDYASSYACLQNSVYELKRSVR